MGFFQDLGGLFGLGGGGTANGEDPANLWNDIISQYSYKPQYTGQTETGLYNLFNSLTGLGGGGVNAIPFDIGLPTTGLYDALTRGIKEQYLGTPGGPESGTLSNLRSYYNNMGIPEYAANQERLGLKDMNNSLLDEAAKINESQKDRLLNVLSLGSNIGNNLYSQDLAQQRYNTGVAQQGAMTDLGLMQNINSANNSALGSLSGLATNLLGGNSSFNPVSSLMGLFGNKSTTAPTSVNQTGGSSSISSLFNSLNPSLGNSSLKSTTFK